MAKPETVWRQKNKRELDDNPKYKVICISPYQYTYQFSSVSQLCLTLSDPMDCSTPGVSICRQLPEFTQTLVH